MSGQVLLKTMIENLGFEDGPSGKLSNWVREILKNKENFSQYIAEKKHKTAPVELYVEAETLVENLCTIYPFKRLFERNGKRDNDKEYGPYRDLRNGNHHRYLGEKASFFQKEFIIEKEQNTNALVNLKRFVTALQRNTEIDITKESIQDQMRSIPVGCELTHFEPHELACWNELVQLRSEARMHPENSLLHRKMAEQLLELNLVEQGLDQLRECLELNPDDGIAWAIRAKVLLGKIAPIQKGHLEALAMTDFLGHIEYPITSEERWINERIDETADSIETTRQDFVEASILALLNWPSWDVENMPPRYYSDLSQADECITSVGRSWLFFHLVMQLSLKDFDVKYSIRENFLSIFNSFKYSKREGFPCFIFSPFSIECKNEDQLKKRIIFFMGFLAPEQKQDLLAAFVSQFKDQKYNAKENIKHMRDPLIFNDLWKFLGADEYLKLYERLEKDVASLNGYQKNRLIADQVLRELYSIFHEPLELYKKYSWGVVGDSKLISQENIANSFYKATRDANEQVSLLSCIIEKNCTLTSSSSHIVSGESLEVLWLTSLIKLKSSGCQQARELLDDFASSPDLLKSSLSLKEEYILRLFNEFWVHDKMHPGATKPEKFFLEADKILEDEMAEEFWD